MRALPFLLLLLAIAGPLGAETRYVTDEVSFSLREAPNKGAKFLSGLPSGAQVDVLETQAETGYSKVKTTDGQVGYFETRRLQKQPPTRLLLEEANRKLKEVHTAPGGTCERSGRADEPDSLKFEHSKLQDELNRVKKELDALQRTSANAVRISMERNELRQQLAELTREKTELDQRYLEASNGREQRWFIIGAGVLFGGVILGLLLPNVRFRRQKAYPGY
jgi:SH3 domain protein